MKVYISSTLQDLRDHRAAVDRALRRMGHDVIGMEQYVAESARPLDRCVTDVKAADLYVLILAWRYGYVPTGDESNPGHLSITHLEFNAARDAGKPVLAFLLDPEAPWPPNNVDAMTTNTEAAEGIARLRDEVATNYLAGIFRTADDLASQAAAAVATQRLGQRLVERLLDQTAVTATSMGNFGQGGDLFDTSLVSIKQMVATAGTKRAIVIDLGGGDQWWSTRLYLLASLLRALTGVRQLVFLQEGGRFTGMASPGAVVDALAGTFPELDDVGRAVRSGQQSQDANRETDRQIAAFQQVMSPPPSRPAGRQPARAPKAGTRSGSEVDVKVGVRPELLEVWLGERLVSRCIRIDERGTSMVEVQQIVDSLLPDVPLELWKWGIDEPPKVQVVDRDAFALELAREWVRSELPRTPIR